MFSSAPLWYRPWLRIFIEFEPSCAGCQVGAPSVSLWPHPIYWGLSRPSWCHIFPPRALMSCFCSQNHTEAAPHPSLIISMPKACFKWLKRSLPHGHWRWGLLGSTNTGTQTPDPYDAPSADTSLGLRDWPLTQLLSGIPITAQIALFLAQESRP